MRFRHYAPLPYALAFLMIVLAGCHRPPAPSPLSPSYSVARDGYLRYRLPVGWFDVTADSQAHGHAVWLLRNDYGGTITVNALRIDRNARGEIEHNGLAPLARLTAALSTQDKGAFLDRQPEEFLLRDHRCCSYELVSPSTGDRTKVILLDTGERIYAVTALTAGGKANGSAAEIENVQMEFLEACRW